jgi:hypothetical protein
MHRRDLLRWPAAARFIYPLRRDRLRSATESGARAGDAGTDVWVLRLVPKAPLEDGQGKAFIDAVRGRAFAARPPVATVVFGLGAVEDLDSNWCDILLSLNDSLGAGGIRLRLADVPRRVHGVLDDAGVIRHIGADAIHSSVRSAVLATYAAMPGPGLVTSQVLAALASCTEDAPPGGMTLRLRTGTSWRAGEPADAVRGEPTQMVVRWLTPVARPSAGVPAVKPLTMKDGESPGWLPVHDPRPRAGPG